MLTKRASICVTYCLQFLDKLSLNYASAYTFIPDLGLEGHRYSWVAAIFNFGYLFWALPANLLIQKLPIGKLTGTMIFIWSILLIAHVGAKNYGGILVLRFLLGMFEAGISPSIRSIVSMFYTRAEQPWRMCIFLGFNGMSTIVGSLLGYGLGHVNHAKIASWQLIFLVIGLMNFVWSIVFVSLPWIRTTVGMLIGAIDHRHAGLGCERTVLDPQAKGHRSRPHR